MTDHQPEDESGQHANTGITPASSDMTRSKGTSAEGPVEPVIRQLDAIIENLASFAAPVLREIAARAADLAAKAGEAAGPIAHRAAEKTEEVGGRLATKGREVASDLRRDTVATRPASGTIAPEPREQTPAEEEAGLPPR
jgi:hypothetical protein